VTYDHALDGLASDGRENIGLDSVFKFTSYRHPTWIVVYRHKKSGRGVCAGLCFASSKEAIHVKNFMNWLRNLVEKKNSKENQVFRWDPVVMIDHDESERKGLLDAGFMFILCNFHVTVDISPKLNSLVKDPEHRTQIWEILKMVQRSKTKEELDSNIDIASDKIKKISPEFWNYLNTNWLCENWKVAFCDIFRKNLEGLWNTNNFTESQIKLIGLVFLKQRRCPSLFLLLTRICYQAVPNFIKKILNDDKCEKPKVNPTDRAIRRRMDSGEALHRQGFVKEVGTEFLVTSATSKKGVKYTVKLQTASPEQNPEDSRSWWYCNCRFWFWSGKCCKHIFAVLFHTKSELISDIRRNTDTSGSSVPVAPRGRPANLEKAPRRVFKTHKKTGRPSVPKTFMEGEGPVVVPTDDSGEENEGKQEEEENSEVAELSDDGDETDGDDDIEDDSIEQYQTFLQKKTKQAIPAKKLVVSPPKPVGSSPTTLTTLSPKKTKKTQIPSGKKQKITNKTSPLQKPTPTRSKSKTETGIGCLCLSLNNLLEPKSRKYECTSDQAT